MDQWNKSVCKSLRHVNSKWFFLLLRGPTFRNCPTIPWVCSQHCNVFSQNFHCCPTQNSPVLEVYWGEKAGWPTLLETYDMWHVTWPMENIDGFSTKRHVSSFFIVSPRVGWIHWRTSSLREIKPLGGFSEQRVLMSTALLHDLPDVFRSPEFRFRFDVGTVISVLFQAWHKNPKLSRLTTVLGWILVFWQIIQHWSKFQQLKTQFSGSSLVISLGYNAVIPKHNSLKGLKDEYLVGRIPF